MHLVNTGGAAPGFDLTLVLSQVDVNVALGDDVFRVEVPKGAVPITLDELRRTGPLADRKAHD
jgi:hypothetical protein